MSTSLELFSTRDLLLELAGRYEHAIFAGIKFRPTEEQPDAYVRSWRVKGNAEMCQGLACGLISHLQADKDHEEDVVDEGDV